MKNASKDIESAVLSVIEGLEYNIDIDQTDDDKIKSAMESKVTAFTVAKDLLHKWRNSRNAPSNRTLIGHITRLIAAGETAANNLRDALGKKIDYESIDASKIKGAIQSKPVIYKAMFDIEAGVLELKKQIESGKINVEDTEYEIGFPEKFASGEIMNLDNHFKSWYNDRSEAVKICPFGTEGEIIEIEDLRIQLPKPPKDLSTVLYSDLPKEEQYWRRAEVPLGLIRETQNEYIEYIHEEFKRRVEGLWFMNNGKPTYMTGDMYFALQHCRMLDDGKFMTFRMPQANLFYFLQACIVDTRCLGDLFEKSRRTGFTYIVLFIILNRITMAKNQKAGITSKTDKDAEEAFLKFSYAFLNLPFFFRPVVRGNQESGKRFEFAKPIELSKEAKKKSDMNIEKYLNSTIDYRPSTNSSYDSIQLNWYLCDEAGKRKKPQHIIKHLGQVTPTMIKGGRVVGKAFVGSTVGDKDEGGENYQKLADSSNVKDRDKITGQTSSRLYRHALYAHENHEIHIDKYGFCHTVRPKDLTYNGRGEPILTGSMEYLLAIAQQKRRISDVDYNEFLRTDPMSRGDMYRYKSTQNQFNQNKITEQKIYNKDLDRDYVMRGNFVWHNGEYDTKVEWRPDPHGKFYVTWLQSQDRRNKVATIDGIKYPMNGQMGRGGVDSFDIDETVDGRASNGALHLYNMYNSEDNTPKYQFVLEYIERPPYAEIFYEDVLMASVFYGYPLLIERNKEEIIKYFKQRGYRGYVMQRPKEYTPESNIRRKIIEYGIPSNSRDVIIQHAGKIERYIHYHVGIWTKENEEEENTYGRNGYRQIDSCGSMLFERTLNDWSTFDINDRTKYDGTISSGYALMAADVSFRSFDYMDNDGNQKNNIKSLARRYEYVNGVPRRV